MKNFELLCQKRKINVARGIFQFELVTSSNRTKYSTDRSNLYFEKIENFQLQKKKSFRMYGG